MRRTVYNEHHESFRQIVNRITIEVQGGQKPACVVDAISVLVP
jgi:hypothetical protein